MSSEEYFALALRIIGVLTALYGLGNVMESGLGMLGYFTTSRTAYSFYCIIGVAQFCAGLYLLRGAPSIVRYAYPFTSENETGDIIDAESHRDSE